MKSSKIFPSKGIILVGLFWMFTTSLGVFARADIPELSIQEALEKANSYSPELKAAISRESQAKSKVGIAESFYLPSVNLEAIDSTGFPGSTSILGVTGLPGSPFRSGFSAGAVLTQNIFDFGRTHYGVKAAEFDVKSQENSTQIDRYQVEQRLISAFMDCVLNRAQEETWQELSRDTELVAREVDRFVNTGQRSIVDRYLERAQQEQAKTNTLDYQVRTEVSAKRLALLTGINTAFSCPGLSGDADSLSLKTASPNESPFIQYAKTRLNAAESRLSKAKAENLPQLVGVASAGYLERARLVDSQDYSLGIGIVFPLFEGLRVKNETDENAAQVQERDFQLESSRLDLDNLNQQYDEKILSAKVRMQNLRIELDNAITAFNVAKKRYLAFQGTLVDVRDALGNLARVKSDLNIAQSGYFESQSLKNILNNQN